MGEATAAPPPPGAPRRQPAPLLSRAPTSPRAPSALAPAPAPLRPVLTARGRPVRTTVPPPAAEKPGRAPRPATGPPRLYRAAAPIPPRHVRRRPPRLAPPRPAPAAAAAPTPRPRRPPWGTHARPRSRRAGASGQGLDPTPEGLRGFQSGWWGRRLEKCTPQPPPPPERGAETRTGRPSHWQYRLPPHPKKKRDREGQHKGN